MKASLATRTARLGGRFALLVSLLAIGACDGGGVPSPDCRDDSDCAGGLECVDGRCTTPRDAGSDGGRDGGPASDAGLCESGSRRCGDACCASGEVCGANATCCPRAELCGSTCCDTGEVCEGALCRRDCGDAVRCHDAAGAEVCCGEGEVCASDRCFLPTQSCEDFFDCGAGEYCETSLGQCLPQPTGEECALLPSGGDVVPTKLWQWDGSEAALPAYNQVMMAPMVASLNDDDGDGDADEDDIPDIVFNTFCGVRGAGCVFGNYRWDGVLRAVSGRDGSAIFDVTSTTLRTNPGSQVALGDLDDDGWNEVVTCASDASDGIGDLIAFRHDGTLYWRSTDPRIRCSEAAPAIADLDADGDVEVFLRYTVLDGTTGAVIWHQECRNAGGFVGDAHSPCDYTTAADLDGDGQLEVVGGNVAYRADGTALYDRSATLEDGYPAVGDLDLDGRPEVVVVQSAFTASPYAGSHYLRALRADGEDLWGPVDINAGLAPAADVAANTVGGGGPPTIANVDDDPEPEITTAGAYAYVVFEPDGTVRWSSISNDRSSRKTGSSVFDFDGDGAAEVVYNDQYWLRVYDGRSGDVRFCLCNTTATLWEYPVIADVNRDGHAEIVVASNDYAASISSCATSADLGPCELERIAAAETAGSHGIRVFASPRRDWVGTRSIWNQHTYHVTNVSARGGIPRVERPSWSVPALNNFRLNVQPGATNLPDLAAIDLAVDLGRCNESMTLNFRVQNQGWAAAPSGSTAAVYVEDGGSFVLVARVTTTRALLSGESEAFTVPFPLGARLPSAEVRFRVVVNDDGDPEAPDVLECRDANNAAETRASCSIVI